VKALLQRVTRASVTVGHDEVGKIGRGLVIFLGVAGGDTEKDAEYLAQKVANMRIFADNEGKFNLSALDTLMPSCLLSVSSPCLPIPGKGGDPASLVLHPRNRLIN